MKLLRATIIFVLLQVTFLIHGLSTNRNPLTGGAISSNVISNLAVLALKLRLKDQTDVQCFVDADPIGLLSGRVNKVKVSGKGWCSPKGLTCRLLEANVSECNLDLLSAIQKQKLILTTPARGQALVALNAVDFGNFITSTRLKPPSFKYIDNIKTFTFVKEETFINVDTNEVRFVGVALGEKWDCALSSNKPKNQHSPSSSSTVGGAMVKVVPRNLNAETAPQQLEAALILTSSLSNFFNQLVFELDGTFLSFKDMQITGRGKSGPSVMLALSITVEKFPSPGIDF